MIFNQNLKILGWYWWCSCSWCFTMVDICIGPRLKRDETHRRWWLSFCDL